MGVSQEIFSSKWVHQVPFLQNLEKGFFCLLKPLFVSKASVHKRQRRAEVHLSSDIFQGDGFTAAVCLGDASSGVILQRLCNSQCTVPGGARPGL